MRLSWAQLGHKSVRVLLIDRIGQRKYRLPSAAIKIPFAAQQVADQGPTILHSTQCPLADRSYRELLRVYASELAIYANVD